MRLAPTLMAVAASLCVVSKGFHGHAAAIADASCATDLDCSLNGACDSSGACICDKGWMGTTCGELKLNQTAVVAYGIGGLNQDTSSWGGGPPVQEDSMFHLFVTEIAGGCGMCTWARMSTIAHAVSPTPQGPYQRVDVAVPTQTHNAYYSYSPTDQMHLLYHIGDGNNPASCNPPFSCSNGSTPGCSGLRPPSSWPAATCPMAGGAHMHYSKSLSGPWTSAGPIKLDAPGLPPAAGTSNPAPYVFPNGTVLLVGRGKDATKFPNGTVIRNHNIFLFRADSWNSTYTWVKSNGYNGALPIGDGKLSTEDQTIWRGRRGFHILFHSHPNLTHAWSADGLQWHWSATVMGPPQPGEAGSDNERPRVSLDENGDIDWVFVAQEYGPGDASRTAAFKAL